MTNCLGHVVYKMPFKHLVHLVRSPGESVDKAVGNWYFSHTCSHTGLTYNRWLLSWLILFVYIIFSRYTPYLHWVSLGLPNEFQNISSIFMFLISLCLQIGAWRCSFFLRWCRNSTMHLGELMVWVIGEMCRHLICYLWLKQNQTLPFKLNHSYIPCFLPFPPPEIISELTERPTTNPFTTIPSSTVAAVITTTARLVLDKVWAIPPPRTTKPETIEQPPTATIFPTLTHHRTGSTHRPIFTKPLQSTAASSTSSFHSSPPPSAAATSFEDSGSGEPSGDDQTEEEEGPEEEAGSGVPVEASGAEPVGKSQLFHFITHNAVVYCSRVLFYKKKYTHIITVHVIICLYF